MVGIDEWAWRRGRCYGTIIVDLERNTVVDLLPGREAGQVADWLKLHPDVEIITRDRADVYGEGARQGAPDAMQVLDRWHLLRNLSEALQEVVTSHHAVIRTVVGMLRNERVAALQTEQASSRPATLAERRKLGTHAPRHARHAEMVRLHAGGASVAGIAHHLGMDRKTVFRWLRRDGPPLWLKPPRASVIDPHRTYLDRRWSEGCRNAAALARELNSLGARIKPRVVRAWALARRRAGADTLDAAPAGPARAWTRPGTRQIGRLLQRDLGELTGEDAAFVARLRERAPDLARAADLAGRLARMLRQKSPEPVADWLAEAGSSPLKRFADGLGRDVVGVENAIATPWTTSPVEGQVNRLKLIKRQMYGRASFDLLRHRVLAAA